MGRALGQDSAGWLRSGHILAHLVLGTKFPQMPMGNQVSIFSWYVGLHFFESFESFIFFFWVSTSYLQDRDKRPRDLLPSLAI